MSIIRVDTSPTALPDQTQAASADPPVPEARNSCGSNSGATTMILSRRVSDR